MNIAIIGTGGVGGYYGGMLSRILGDQLEHRLYFIARGKHLEVIRSSGLRLEAAEGSFTCVPYLATDDFSELPELDLCIITVKSYELENVSKQLLPKIKPDSVIMPLLNGADIHERIRRIIKTGIILPSCVYIVAFVEEPGKVVRKGESCVLHTGFEIKDGLPAGEKPEEVLELLNESGIDYRWHDDPQFEIWRKYIFIASFALVTGRYNASLGEVMDSEEMSADVKGIIGEIRLIAEAKGIDIDDEICEKAYSLGGKFGYSSTTSFQRDYLIKDKPDERDIFGGAIIRMGKEYGVETPVTERIFSEIEKNKPL